MIDAYYITEKIRVQKPINTKGKKRTYLKSKNQKWIHSCWRFDNETNRKPRGNYWKRRQRLKKNAVQRRLTKWEKKRKRIDALGNTQNSHTAVSTIKTGFHSRCRSCITAKIQKKKLDKNLWASRVVGGLVCCRWNWSQQYYSSTQ